MDQQSQSIFESVIAHNLSEAEFHQAARGIFESLESVTRRNPGYLGDKILERICGPGRQIVFRTPWVDDRGTVRVNRDFRIEFNSAPDPYKGGLRLRPSVYLGIIRFLGFEQVPESSLIGLPINGDRGSSDFNPHGGSDIEIMRFCRSFMAELYCHLGKYISVPTGDIGVDGHEIDYMFGQYRRVTNRYESGVPTGKSLNWGGSLVRTETTGRDVVTFTQEMLKIHDDTFNGKRVTVPGSGSMAIYAIGEIQRLGRKVVACSNSSGYVVDGTSIDVGLLEQAKEVERGRAADYASRRDSTELGETGLIWDVAVNVILPYATWSGLNREHATTLIRNGVKAVIEGANMPTTSEGIHAFRETEVLFALGKAADTGGTAASGLEMQQNAMYGSWAFGYTEKRLTNIMCNIHDICAVTTKECGTPGDYVVNANITDFIKVANIVQVLELVRDVATSLGYHSTGDGPATSFWDTVGTSRHTVLVRRIVLLDSTGPIDAQTLDVIGPRPDWFNVMRLVASGGDIDLLVRQAARLRPSYMALARADRAASLEHELTTRGVGASQLLTGPEAATELAVPECDVMANAITGATGLEPILTALRAGLTLALANKESPVIGGGLVTGLAAPGQLVAIGSGHSAFAQALRRGRRHEVTRFILTTSGGPFRGRSHEKFVDVTPKGAMAHPAWKMGQTIIIDSSTLISKELEFIEAALLYGVGLDDTVMTVHPQSVVRSTVGFTDGSALTQASLPNMRLPIGLVLTWSDRLPGTMVPRDWTRSTIWTFESLGDTTSPAAGLARRVRKVADTAPAIYNATNEMLVDTFCGHRIGLLGITDLISRRLAEHLETGHTPDTELTLEAVPSVDVAVRERARELMERLP